MFYYCLLFIFISLFIAIIYSKWYMRQLACQRQEEIGVDLRRREHQRQEAIVTLRTRIEQQLRTVDAASPHRSSATTTAGTDSEVIRAKVVDTLFPIQTIKSSSSSSVTPSAPPMEQALVPEDDKKDVDDSKDQNDDKEQLESTRLETCTICLDAFENGDSIVTGGDCSHKYHRSCIFEWLGNNDDCPNCRRPMWDSHAYDVVNQSISATSSSSFSRGVATEV